MTRAIAYTVALFLLLGGCLFGAAGQLSWLMAWAVLCVYSVSKAATFAFVDPDLIRERAVPGPGVDRGDVVLATLGYLGLYPGTFVVAGLDAVRFGPAIPIPQSIQVTALLVFALGYGFAFWAVRSNPFFTTYVRIQGDRDHWVVSSGPCALVRHPGYPGALAANTFCIGADAVYTARGALDGAFLDRWTVMQMDYDAALEDMLASKAVVDWVRGLRARAAASRNRRIVSTRMMRRMQKGLHAGLTMAEAKEIALQGWKAEELAKVGEGR